LDLLTFQSVQKLDECTGANSMLLRIHAAPVACTLAHHFAERAHCDVGIYLSQGPIKISIEFHVYPHLHKVFMQDK
jgi:hypothetical protein